MKILKFMAYLSEHGVIRIEDAEDFPQDHRKEVPWRFTILDGDFPTPATLSEIRSGFWRLRVGGTVEGQRFWGTADEILITLGCIGHIADNAAYEDWLETLPTSERPFITTEAADNAYSELLEEVASLRAEIEEVRAMLPMPERDYDPREF